MTLLLDLAIRSAILVLVGLAVAALLHRQCAALRHAVLAMTIVAAAALLPLSAIVPAWRVSLPISAARQAAPNEAPRASLTVSDAARVTPSLAAPAMPTALATTVSAPRARPALSVVRLARLAWLAGFAACAAVLLAGFVRLARVARRAERVRDGEWTRAAGQLQAAYGLRRPVVLLQTDAPDVLATFGIRQHRVLLPVHASAWSPDRIRAVLSHELAHVRRQDWLVQMSAEVLRCVYWFNPLMWIACARLRCESEYACDDVVLGRGMAAGDYAVHLLELARLCRHPRRQATVSAIPMARASTLERRITVMLNPAVNHTSVSSRARVAAAALLACLSLSVAAVRAGDGPRTAPAPAASTLAAPAAALSTPDVLMPKVQSAEPGPITRASRVPGAPARPIDGKPPVAAVITNAAQSVAPLVGSIYDASGGIIPGVTVTLRDAQQAASTAVTDAAGRFQFPSVAPGTYTLEAALPGFRTLRQNIELRAAQDWDRVITLQLGQIAETVVVSTPRVGPSTPAQTQPTRLKVGGNIRPPRKVVDVKPVYPDTMRDAGREATVSLDAVIGTDGSVTSVRVVSADIHPDFAIAAADAVRQWKFDPTRLNGVAVEVQMTVSVEFRLSQ